MKTHTLELVKVGEKSHSLYSLYFKQLYKNSSWAHCKRVQWSFPLPLSSRAGAQGTEGCCCWCPPAKGQELLQVPSLLPSLAQTSTSIWRWQRATWNLLFGARPGARVLASRLLPCLRMTRCLPVALVNLYKPSKHICTSLLEFFWVLLH